MFTWVAGNFLNRDIPEHHSTDRLKERGEEKEVHPLKSVTICVQPEKHWYYCAQGNPWKAAKSRAVHAQAFPSTLRPL